MGKVVYLKKVFEESEWHFEKSVEICKGVGWYQVAVVNCCV